MAHRRPGAHCHLEVVCGAGGSFVIVTELANNRGMSTTNAAEQIAVQVVERFELDPATTTFVEHYGPMSAQPSERKRDADHYSLVLFDWSKRGEQWVASDPHWERISPEQLAHLRETLTLPPLDAQDIERPSEQELIYDYFREQASWFAE